MPLHPHGEAQCIGVFARKASDFVRGVVCQRAGPIAPIGGPYAADALLRIDRVEQRKLLDELSGFCAPVRKPLREFAAARFVVFDEVAMQLRKDRQLHRGNTVVVDHVGSSELGQPRLEGIRLDALTHLDALAEFVQRGDVDHQHVQARPVRRAVGTGGRWLADVAAHAAG